MKKRRRIEDGREREKGRGSCGLQVSRFQAKIDENFAHYFLKTKANNKCFIVLNVTCKGLQKV